MSSLFIILAGICWWLDGLLRSKVGDISPLVVVTLEHFIGFCILAIIGWKHLKFPKLTRNWWLALIGVAFFSGLVGTYAFTWAMGHIHYSSFTVIFLLLKLQPIFAIFAALLFLWERPKSSFYWLALVALIASYFLSFGATGLDISFGSDALRASLAGLVAALCWWSATVFSKYLSWQWYRARTMTAFRLGMVAAFGVITLSIASLLWIQWSLTLNFELWTLNLIIAIALLSGVLGTTLYYRGIRETPASLASIFELSLPITGFLLDLTLHSKILDIYQWIGAIVLTITMSFIARLWKTKK